QHAASRSFPLMVKLHALVAGTPFATHPAHIPAGGRHATSLYTAHRMSHCSDSLWSGQVGFPPAPLRWPQEGSVRGRVSIPNRPQKGIRTQVQGDVASYAEFLRKPTVSLCVTCAVADTYGCDDGRIGPTRCAIIAAGLDGRGRPCRTCRTPLAAARS